MNSDEWTVVSLGCDSRFMRQGADQWLLNRIDKKAINATKYCADTTLPTKKHYRGDLWVSNQDDVIPSLWTYVENRDSERSRWNAIMAGLPDSAEVAETAIIGYPGNMPGRRNLHVARAAANALNISYDAGCPARVELFSVSGKRILDRHIEGASRAIVTPRLAQGHYRVRVTTRDGVFSVPVAVVE